MISLDLMKSSEVRIAGDQSYYDGLDFFHIQNASHIINGNF